LNVHQDDDPYSEPLRFAVAIAAGLPVITEKCLDTYPYKGTAIIEAEYQNIPETIRRVLGDDYDPYKKAATEMRAYILDKFNFRDCVLRAMEK
jgi:hypothetical protein